MSNEGAPKHAPVDAGTDGAAEDLLSRSKEKPAEREDFRARSKATPDGADIRKTIDELLREIGSQVSTNPDTFPAAKLELLERLQKLDAALARTRSRSRFLKLKLLLAGLALIAAFAYLLGPLTETRTDISGTATELLFTADQRVSLFEDTSVESVTCDGIDESNLGDLSPGESAGPRSISVSSANGTSQNRALVGAIRADRPPSVTLQFPPIPPNSKVTITHNPAETGLRITVEGGDGNTVTAMIVFEGAVRLTGIKSPAYFAPRTFILRGKTLVANLVPKQPFSLRRSIRVHGLSFEDPAARSDGPGEPASTILEGSVVFTELGGAQKALQEGQPFRLVKGRGLLRSFDVTDKGLKFAFSGIANDIRDGFDQNAPSAMPSKLEWIRGNPRVSLLWAAIAWLTGTLLAVIKYWREIVK
ncbi:MAG TPA: hypothetical protein VG675_04860 [Bryobacteraceae bacterium]|nr:hypothetical protein [Bryobacteraceae bacterium]